MRNTTRILAAIAVLSASACDSPYHKVDPKTGIPILPEPKELIDSNHAGLSVGAQLSKSDCRKIDAALRASAMREVYTAIQSQLEQAWTQKEKWCDYSTPSYGWSDGGAAADSGAATVPSPDDKTPEHSGTNNQVASVDEPDVVKTDGKYIYLADRKGLHIVKSWPAEQTATSAHLAIEGTPKKLFVHGDRALIYSSRAQLDSNRSYGYGYSGYDSSCTYGYDCVPRGDGLATRITVVDISDRSAPQIVRVLDIQSSLLAARRVGNAVHTVLTRTASTSGPQVTTYPRELDVCDSSKGQIYRAYERLLKEQVARLAKFDFTTTLPSLTDKIVVGDGAPKSNSDPLGDCDNFLRASISDGNQYTSVLSLRIDTSARAKAVTILSRPGVTYASADSLYLAVPYARSTQYEWYGAMSAHDEATALHKFKLDSDGAGADYAASGLVKGRILNQFALDERDGALRIASTTGHVGGGINDSSVHNTLTVLQQRGRALDKIGQLDGLAPGEDIRSVRFDGERGYIVTFKKTDPLFVLDLADPRAPRVLGELKIPGFSTYMHRMDKNHLLTIGYDADDQGGFAWFTGVMLQIFDVSNPTKPSLKFKHVIGTRGSSSEALTNHLAFTYYAPKNILSLPMTVCEGSDGGGSYGWDLTFSGLMVFDVTADAGFSLRGKVGYPLPERSSYGGYYNDSCGNWWTNASSQVKRSVIIGDYVYSLSQNQLKVNALADLSRDIATVSLDLP